MTNAQRKDVHQAYLEFAAKVAGASIERATPSLIHTVETDRMAIADDVAVTEVDGGSYCYQLSTHRLYRVSLALLDELLRSVRAAGSMTREVFIQQ